MPMAVSLPEETPRSHGRLGVRLTLKPRDLMEDAQVKGAFTVKVITLFPEAFPGTLGLSITGKAMDLGLWRLQPIPLRAFGEGKHRAVDDTPAGGGAGMVIRPDVMERALTEAGSQDRAKWPLVFLTPRGKPFTQAMARRYSQGQGMTLICGRFEGLDQRVIDHYGIEEVSMGDFVLTGGEIPAQALIDATVRLLPKVLGNADSAVEESFSHGLLEHPQYTRPAVWKGHEVPPVLMGGNHAEIAKWREAESHRVTAERRPDLWAAHQATAKKPLKGPALRRAIRALVEACPGDTAQALTWIDSGAELMRVKKPATPPVQLVSYCLPVDGDQVLLGLHRSGLWLPPGGHVEPGEHPTDAARREAREELRQVADLRHEAPVLVTWTGTVGDGPHVDVALWYLLHGHAGQIPDFDRAEFSQMRWFPLSALPEGAEPNLSRLKL